MRTFAQKPGATHLDRAGSQAARVPSSEHGSKLTGYPAGNVARFESDFSQIPIHRATTAEPAGGDGVPSPGVPLQSGLRAIMEARFGETLDDVRVHCGPAAHRSARRLGARAYTHGSHIVLDDQVSAAEFHKPTSALLTHELTHVLQYRRAGNRRLADRVAPANGPAEREARQSSLLIRHGLPAGRVRMAAEAIALTPTSVVVENALTYDVDDWEVTAADEQRILDALDRDPDLFATINDLNAAGMLDALLDRVDEPANRRHLLHLLGRGLNAAGRTLVEPSVRKLGMGAELQFNLARLGVTSGAPAFNPAALDAAVVGTARTPQSGSAGGHLTDSFTGVGATGVIPVTKHVGKLRSTQGVPEIPLVDQALLAMGHAKTVATYSNPLGDLSAYLGTLSATQRTQQAELLLKRPIASVETGSYAGNLPSRAQVIKAAAKAHNLHGSLVAAFFLAEQRDQTQAEDAKDYQGAISVMQGDTSIGLGQVVVSTAQSRDLFADLVSTPTRTKEGLTKVSGTGHDATAKLLASDEYNIFAAARYIRQVADKGATMSLAALPNTAAAYPGINLAAYAGNSITWPADNIRALGSEYTSKAWDDALFPFWGEFVYQAYLDVVATGIV